MTIGKGDFFDPCVGKHSLKHSYVRIRRDFFRGDRDTVVQARKIYRHLCGHGLNTLLRHLLQIVVVPPRLRDMMISEDLSLVGDEKSGPENIKVYFRTVARYSNERIPMVVSHRFAVAG